MITPENALHGHTDEASAYVVDDYPYGFRLRCKIRYWIETTKNGDRFVSQTTNPKVAVEKWNKPKKSTYAPVMCMFLNDEGHVTHAGFSTYTKPEAGEAFLAVMEEHLSDSQKRQVAMVKAVNKVYSKVEWTITEGATTPEHDAEQEAIKARINNAVRHEAASELRQL